jgi:hypothetical protein
MCKPLINHCATVAISGLGLGRREAMPLRKEQKLMLLFVSKNNPIWQSLLGQEPTQKEITQITGAVASKVSKWRSGEAVSDLVADRVFNATTNYLKSSSYPSASSVIRKIDRFQKAFRAKAPMIEAAAILGLSTEAAQRAIDHIIYDELPLFSKIYEGAGGDGMARASEVVAQYGGTYRCYLERGNETLICALRVRYALQIGNGWAVRCKLNLPKTAHWRSDDEPEIWEYDGFLARRERNLFWTFEKRAESRSDFLYFITAAEHRDGRCQQVAGTYLTTNQSPEPGITTGNIYIDRTDLKNAKDIAKFMRTTPNITSRERQQPDRPPEDGS